MKFDGHLTIKSMTRHPHIVRVVNCLSIATRDLRNNAIFVCRQLHTAKRALRAGEALHDNQKIAIAAHDAAVAILQDRAAARNENTPFVAFSEAYDLSNLEKRGLLNEIMKDYKAPDQEHPPYRLLPAQSAQATNDEVRASFKAFRRATASYFEAHAQKKPRRTKAATTKKEARKQKKAKAANDKFTGRPEMPGYLKKDMHPGVPFPGQNLLKAKRLTAISELHGLPEQVLKSWVDYDLMGQIEKAKRSRVKGDLAMIRLAPSAHGVVDMFFVFHDTYSVADDSAAALLHDYEEKRKAELKARRKARALDKAKQKNKQQNKSEAEEKAKARRKAPPKAKPEPEPKPDYAFLGHKNIASIDPGMNSLATITFRDGSPAIVIDPRRYDEAVKRLDRRIDKRKSQITPPEALRADITARRRGWLLNRAWNADPVLARLRRERKNYIANAVHQMSSAVVDALAYRKVDVVVVGRNRRLKAETSEGKGKGHNRRAHRFPHHEFAAQLEYKLKRLGKAVLLTEESNTSKASFANSAPLTYEKGEPRRHMGTRKGSKYRSRTSPRRWRTVHSDLNGSYNIGRKLFPDLVWNKGLSSGYQICWFTPKGKLALFDRKSKAG